MNGVQKYLGEAKEKMNIRKISLLALFIGLTVVGASIKVPAMVSSVALDSFPALLASVFFGGGAGAIVAGVGHMMSALLGGMPMGPFHLIVAIEMAILVFVFAVLWRKRIISSLVFVIGNTFIAPLPFIFFFDVAFYMALLPSLFIGSLINTAVALLLIPRLSSIFQEAYAKGAVKG